MPTIVGVHPVSIDLSEAEILRCWFISRKISFPGFPLPSQADVFGKVLQVCYIVGITILIGVTKNVPVHAPRLPVAPRFTHYPSPFSLLFSLPPPPYYSVSCADNGCWCNTPGIGILFNFYLLQRIIFQVDILPHWKQEPAVGISNGSVFLLCSVILSSSPPLIIQLLAWPARQVSKAFIIIFLPRYYTGFLWRQVFLPRTVLPVVFFDAAFFCTILFWSSSPLSFIRAWLILWGWFTLGIANLMF